MIPSTKDIVSSIFSSRLGTTPDPHPNADSWKGHGSTTTFYINRNTMDIPHKQTIHRRGKLTPPLLAGLPIFYL